MNYWTSRVREEIARQGHIGIDPRHVEGYMLVGNHGILGDLSKQQFKAEVAIGIKCTLAEGTVNAEKLAHSWGL